MFIGCEWWDLYYLDIMHNIFMSAKKDLDLDHDQPEVC